MQGLILIAAAVLLVWGAVVLVRGGPLGGCLLWLGAIACLGPSYLALDAGPLRLSIDRIFWLVVMFQALVWRQRGWDREKGDSPHLCAAPEGPFRQMGTVPFFPAADSVLLALVGYLGLRTFTSDWQVDGGAPVVHFVLTYAMPLGIYWAARQLRPSPRATAALLASLALFGVYLAVVVVAERCEAYWLVWPRYIVDTLSNKNLEFIGRGRGPLLNPMVTGIMLAACGSAAVLATARWSRLGRAALAPLWILLGLAVWCTLTRTVWIGAAASLAIVVGAEMQRRWRLPVLGAAVLAAAMLAATHWEQVIAFKRDRLLTEQDTASSVYLRPVMAVLAWHMFLDHPVVGCGFDQYRRVEPDYLADRSTSLVLEKARGTMPHNVFLAMLTETGLVGLGLYVALLALWTRQAWRLWRDASAPRWARQPGLLFLATLAAFLVNGAFHHVAFIPMSNSLLFFLAGVTAAWGHCSEGKGDRSMFSDQAAPESHVV